MVTPEVRLMILYDVESRMMRIMDRLERSRDKGWKVVQGMIEDEYRHRDALARSPLSGRDDD